MSRSRRTRHFGHIEVKVRRSDYKTTRGWLNRIYRDNKETIDRALEGTGIKNARKSFVQSVEDELKEGKKRINLPDGRMKYVPHQNVQSALRSVGRSEAYLSEAEKFQQNAIAGLKSTDQYMEFRNKALRDPKTGRYTAFDPSKFKYVGKGSYVYDGRVAINYQTSPKGKKGGRMAITEL